MKNFSATGIAVITSLGLISPVRAADPLPSWNEGPRFGLITDAEREYAYDRSSHIGRLNKALNEAAQRGWIAVDMKKDWNQKKNASRPGTRHAQPRSRIATNRSFPRPRGKETGLGLGVSNDNQFSPGGE